MIYGEVIKESPPLSPKFYGRKDCRARMDKSFPCPIITILHILSYGRFLRMTRFPCFIALLTAACLALTPQISAAQDSGPAPVIKDGTPRHVITKLIPEFQSVTPGQPLSIAVDQTMESGWHTYWKNPGDSGEATSITWSLPKGWKSDAF